MTLVLAIITFQLNDVRRSILITSHSSFKLQPCDQAGNQLMHSATNYMLLAENEDFATCAFIANFVADYDYCFHLVIFLFRVSSVCPCFILYSKYFLLLDSHPHDNARDNSDMAATDCVRRWMPIVCCSLCQ